MLCSVQPDELLLEPPDRPPVLCDGHDQEGLSGGLQSVSMQVLLEAMKSLQETHQRDIQTQLSALEDRLLDCLRNGATTRTPQKRVTLSLSTNIAQEARQDRHLRCASKESDDTAGHASRDSNMAQCAFDMDDLLADEPTTDAVGPQLTSQSRWSWQVSTVRPSQLFDMLIVERWADLAIKCFHMASLARPWSLSRNVLSLLDRTWSWSASRSQNVYGSEGVVSKKSIIGGEESPQGMGDLAETLRVRAKHHRMLRLQSKVMVKSGSDVPRFAMLRWRQDSNWATFLAVTHPKSPLRITWDVIGAVSILVSLVAFPLHAFDLSDYQRLLFVHGLCSGIFWSLDICLSFNLGFYDSLGELQLDRKRIAKRYLARYLFFDLVVTIVEWVVVLNMFNVSLSFSIQWLRLLRLFRFFDIVLGLVRMAKRGLSASLVNQIKGNWLADVLSATISVALPAFVFTLSVHYVACGWFWIRTSGAGATDVERTESTTAEYLSSFSWALAQSTQVATDIYPVTVPERAFAIAAMWILTFPLACVVISIASAASEFLDPKGAQELAELHEFFREYKIPMKLRSQTEDIVLQRSIQRSKLVADVRLLSMLPIEDVRMLKTQAFMRTMRVHPLFSLVEDSDSALVRSICNNVIKEECFVIHQTVVEAFKPIREMIFVENGFLNFRDHNGHGQQPEKLKSSEWACELALWCNEVELSRSLVVGSSSCKILGVPADAFRNVVAECSFDSFHFLAVYGMLFVREFNRMVEAEEEPGLFNDPQQITGMASEASCTCSLNVLFGEKCSSRSEFGTTSHTVSEENSFAYLVVSTPKWASLSGDAPFNINAMARIERTAKMRRDLEVAYDFPVSATADARDFAPDHEDFKKANGGKPGSAKPGTQVDWKDPKSVARSHWFVSYKGQVKSAIKVKCQERRVRKVVLLAIRGGPITQLEHRECNKIVQDAKKDNKKMGITKPVEIRVMDFADFVSDFETP